MSLDVAIIGVSFSIAGINSLQEYYKVITDETLKIREIPKIRREDIEASFGNQDIGKAGYLDRIDLFDEKYFGIAKGEATRMDPEQRLMLEHSVKALYNSGYTKKEVAAKRTGFFHTYYHSSYRYFFDDFSNSSLTSHMSGMIGTRIARHLDLKGPVVGYDTTCSSSLVALYYACQSLYMEDCEYAFVGGVNLGVAHAQKITAPIYSNTEKCLPFDHEADGTVPGEGVVCLLLKKLDQAENDNDAIYGIIKGGAINHGGERIQNITAPSQVAQKEVIQRAWKKSNITANDVSFIEAHGTGTELGDPIEYEGIESAFKEKNKTNSCGISSAKGQVGHLDALSGLAGIVRGLVSLTYKIKPKQQGFKTLNPYIHTSLPLIGIQKETTSWESDQDRILGVSSFGLTGTNVHMILKEHSSKKMQENRNSKKHHLVKLSASSKELLKETQNYLISFLTKNPQVNLTDFSYSLNKIYIPNKLECSLFFKNIDELINDLQKCPFKKSDQEKRDMIVLVSGIFNWNDKERDELLSEYPEVVEEISTFISTQEYTELEDFKKNVLIHFGILKTFMNSKTFFTQVVFGESGKVIQQLLSITDNIEKKAFINTIKEDQYLDFKAITFVNYLNKLSENKKPYFFIIGDNGNMLKTLNEWNLEHHLETFCMNKNVSGYTKMLGQMFELNFQVESSIGKGMFLQELQFPILQPRRHWIARRPLDCIETNKELIEGVNTEAASSEKKVFTQLEITAHITEIWKKVLLCETVSLQDNFFEIGGGSLLGLDVLMEMEKCFGISMDYQNIFENESIEKLSVFISTSFLTNTEEDAQSVPSIEKQIENSNLEKEYNEHINELENRTLKKANFKKVFLTGVTGFLGIYLLKELLENTEAIIICIVRPTEIEKNIKDRCYNTYQSYFGNEALSNAYKNRISVIEGDITKPGLGIKVNFQESIDVVYHCAATVNHFGKKKDSDLINYGGTKNVFEWAKSKNVSRFNHISSVAVTGSYITGIDEIDYYETDLDVGQQFGSYIYSSSKFKAEQFLNEHKSEDMIITIFRLGNLGGDSITGNFQKNIDKNIVYMLLKSLYNMGVYPKNYERNIEISPINGIAKTMHLISSYTSNTLEIFHLYNFHKLTIPDVAKAFHNNNLSLNPIDISTFDKLIADIVDEHSEKVSFFSIAKNRTSINTDQTLYHIRTEKTNKFLEKIGYQHKEDAAYCTKLIQHCVTSNFFKPNEKLDHNHAKI